MKLNEIFSVINLTFYFTLLLSIIVMILNIVQRKKLKKNNVYLEYGQLILVLISFLLVLKNQNKFNLIIFLIASTIILITRQMTKLKNDS